MAVFTFPNYHSGVAECADDSLYPELWGDGTLQLLYGWDAFSQQGKTGYLVDYVRSVARNFTSIASADWKGEPEGLCVPRYDGSADADSTETTLDLTGVGQQISVSFDLYWDSFASGDDLAWESSSNFNTNAGALLCDPDSSSGSFGFGPSNGGGNYNTISYPRPSAAAWHHYLYAVDLAAWGTTAANCAVRAVYVDGAPQTLTAVLLNGAAPSDFGNYTWYFMSRAASSLLGAGRLGRFMIYQGLARQEHADLFAAGASPFTRRVRRPWSLGVPGAGGGSTSYGNLLLLGVGG